MSNVNCPILMGVVSPVPSWLLTNTSSGSSGVSQPLHPIHLDKAWATQASILNGKIPENPMFTGIFKTIASFLFIRKRVCRQQGDKILFRLSPFYILHFIWTLNYAVSWSWLHSFILYGYICIYIHAHTYNIMGM